MYGAVTWEEDTTSAKSFMGGSNFSTGNYSTLKPAKGKTLQEFGIYVI